MPPENLTSQQLALYDQLQELYKDLHSINLILGGGLQGGHCTINPCEGCAIEREEAARLAHAALRRLDALSQALAAHGAVPTPCERCQAPTLWRYRVAAGQPWVCWTCWNAKLPSDTPEG